MNPPRPGPPPPRPRAISQPDAEVPESVYHALLGVQGGVQALAAELRTAKADTDEKISDIGKDVADLKARDRAHLAKVIGIVATAVASVIGGQRVLAPAPEPARTIVSESALSSELDACGTLPESNQPNCVGAAYLRSQARKSARQRP